MKMFPHAHATHPQWRMAVVLVLTQLRAQMAQPGYASAPTLALLYITDHYASEAQGILDTLSAELPEITDWSGTVGVGIAAYNVEYWNEPALAVMLCDLPPDQYRVFSGVAPLGLGFAADSALVHADASTPDLSELVAEMAERTDSGYLFGGLASSRTQSVQFAVGGNGNMRGQGAAGGVFSGGLSGVAFGAEVPLVSRITQGCLPLAPAHVITACDQHVLLTLDGEPALDVLERDLGIVLQQATGPALEAAIGVVRSVLVGLSDADSIAVGRTGHLGGDVLVRHILGLDTARGALAIAAPASPGMRLTFCKRNAKAARADLTRICTEIRAQLEPEDLSLEAAHHWAQPDADPRSLPTPHPARRMVGAVYISCAGRGGPHFGSDSAELHIVRRALGEVPLVGFFAGGEIAHNRLYGYTGVLTVFTTD
jgi:small ligand-binding sensory domain FIST